MSTETRLQDLTNSICQLLDCDWTSLYLHCPDFKVRHPLLPLLFVLHPSLSPYYGSVPAPTFLYDEHLWTLCNQAMLTGQCITESAWSQQPGKGQEAIGSIMIAALERSAGVIGFLFCTSRQADAFKEGERRLLTQYISELAWQVEQIVSEYCLTPFIHGERGDSLPGMQEQNAFLSLISHELRAPLTAIKGYAALLHEYGASEDKPIKMSGEQQKRYLAIIMEQVKHLEVLMGDVLDISRMQAGHLALRCTYVDLGRLCQQIVQLMQLRIDQKQPGQYCILCSMDQELPLIWADDDRVQQVLTNLVENAIKYSPDGGLIEIQVHKGSAYGKKCTCIYDEKNYGNLEETQSPATFVCVAISDQGVGIPSQQQSSLFKPFSRLEHPATQHVNGSGLGLYIARKLVEAMHGQVILHSREGEGTTITFTLPVDKVVKRPVQAHPADVPLSQSVSMH